MGGDAILRHYSMYEDDYIDEKTLQEQHKGLTFEKDKKIAVKLNSGKIGTIDPATFITVESTSMTIAKFRELAVAKFKLKPEREYLISVYIEKHGEVRLGRIPFNPGNYLVEQINLSSKVIDKQFNGVFAIVSQTDDVYVVPYLEVKDIKKFVAKKRKVDVNTLEISWHGKPLSYYTFNNGVTITVTSRVQSDYWARRRNSDSINDDLVNFRDFEKCKDLLDLWLKVHKIGTNSNYWKKSNDDEIIYQDLNEKGYDLNILLHLSPDEINEVCDNLKESVTMGTKHKLKQALVNGLQFLTVLL